MRKKCYSALNIISYTQKREYEVFTVHYFSNNKEIKQKLS